RSTDGNLIVEERIFLIAIKRWKLIALSLPLRCSRWLFTSVVLRLYLLILDFILGIGTAGCLRIIFRLRFFRHGIVSVGRSRSRSRSNLLIMGRWLSSLFVCGISFLLN